MGYDFFDLFNLLPNCEIMYVGPLLIKPGRNVYHPHNVLPWFCKLQVPEWLNVLGWQKSAMPANQIHLKTQQPKSLQSGVAVSLQHALFEGSIFNR